MNYIEIPQLQDGRPEKSARERIQEIRQFASNGTLASSHLEEAGRYRSLGWMCDIADILLDAMRYGPDGKQAPYQKQQMQEQGPPEGSPHTGLPPELDGGEEWDRFDTPARTRIREQGLWVDILGVWRTKNNVICVRPNPDGSMGS